MQLAPDPVLEAVWLGFCKAQQLDDDIGQRRGDLHRRGGFTQSREHEALRRDAPGEAPAIQLQLEVHALDVDRLVVRVQHVEPHGEALLERL